MIRKEKMMVRKETTAFTRPIANAIALAVFAWLVAAGAQAAWLVEPSLEVRSSYDDNVRMNEENEQDGIVTTGTAQLQLRNVTERSEVSMLGGVGYIAYADVDDLDNQDLQFLRFTGRQSTERTEFGMRAVGRRDLVLRRLAPILDPLDESAPDRDAGPEARDIDGPLDAGDVDVGAVDEEIRRTRFELAPYVQMNLNERTDVRLGLRYAQRNFGSNAELVGLQDTTTSGADMRLRRAVSPLTSVDLTVGYTLLESDTAIDTDTYRATVGWQHQLSPATAIGADIGANRTENDLSSDTNMRYRIFTNRTTPLNRFSAQLERSAVASPFGGVVQADRLNADYRQLLSERLELNLSLYGFRSERIGEGTQTDREYVEIGPELFWRATQSWRLGAAYRFRWTDREETDGTARSNAVTVSIRYQPPRQL
jgi:opacity protein-like surface antigen